MKRVSAALCFLGLAVMPAFAADSVEWGTSGHWHIRYDASVGGCFMLASYTLGEILRIGFKNVQRNGYLMVANPAWHSLEAGKEYDLSFDFPGDAPWRGTFVAKKLGDLTFLEISFKNPNFLRDFAWRQKVNVYYAGSFVSSMPLTGSRAAMQSLLECQHKADAAAGPPATSSDPFSNPATKPATDPFRAPAPANSPPAPVRSSPSPVGKPPAPVSSPPPAANNPLAPPANSPLVPPQ